MTMEMDDKEAMEAVAYSSCSSNSFTFPSPRHSRHVSSVNSMKVMGMEMEDHKIGKQDHNSSPSSSLLDQVRSVRRMNLLNYNDMKTKIPTDVPAAASSPVNRCDAHLIEENLMNGDQREMDTVPASCSFLRVDCYPPLLAVCVDVNKNCKYAVQWALDTLVSEEESIQIIYVKNPIQTVPTPMGNYMPVTLASKRASNAYRQEVDSQTYMQLQRYQQMCQSRKVHAQIIVLEEYGVPLAIAKHISRCHIKKVVMGSSSRNLFSRMLKTPGVPARVARIAPKFCTIYVISKRKLVSVHSSFSSNRISITYDDNASTIFSGRTSDASISSLQNTSRGKPDFEARDGNTSPWKSLPWKNQDLALGNQATSPIIMNQAYAELQSHNRIREEFSSIETHEFLGSKRMQKLNVSIENESSKHGSIREQYQLTRKSDAEGSTCYDHMRRLQDSAEISKVSPITGTSDERFLSNRDQRPWDGSSDSDSYQHNQGSESLNPNTNMEESMFSVESQFLRNNKEPQITDVGSFSSRSKEGVTKVNQFLDTSKIKEKQCHKEAEENEAFFEICPSDIQDSRRWVPSKVQKFSIASQILDSANPNIEIHSNSYHPMIMEDVGTELDELKLQIKRIAFMYNILYEEATSAKRTAEELDFQRVEETNKLKEAKLREKRALAIAAEEKARRETAVAEAEAAKRIAKVEAKRRKDAELMINRYNNDITMASDNHGLEKVFQRRH